MGNIAVFAGSFDPFTLGHFDIVSRVSGIFDKVYVAVATNTGAKSFKLSVENRINIAVDCVSNINNVSVVGFDGLLTDFIKSVNAGFIVRGLRSSLDFEYEKSLAEVYKSQMPKLDIIHLISPHNYCHISSTIVRELAIMGGCIQGYVHSRVEDKVLKLYSGR